MMMNSRRKGCDEGGPFHDHQPLVMVQPPVKQELPCNARAPSIPEAPRRAVPAPRPGAARSRWSAKSRAPMLLPAQMIHVVRQCLHPGAIPEPRYRWPRVNHPLQRPKTVTGAEKNRGIEQKPAADAGKVAAPGWKVRPPVPPGCARQAGIKPFAPQEGRYLGAPAPQSHSRTAGAHPVQPVGCRRLPDPPCGPGWGPLSSAASRGFQHVGQPGGHMPDLVTFGLAVAR